MAVEIQPRAPIDTLVLSGPNGQETYQRLHGQSGTPANLLSRLYMLNLPGGDWHILDPDPLTVTPDASGFVQTTLYRRTPAA